MGELQDRINNELAQVATNYGAIYVKNIKETISKKDKIASGALYESINYNVYIDEQGVHLEILSLPYLKWIDLGRKPGTQPPVDAILQWIKDRKISSAPGATVRRNILGKFSKGFKFTQGRNSKGQFGSILKQQTSLAWAIAKSIKKKGIKPTNIELVNNNVYSDMEKEANTVVGNILVETFGENIRVIADNLGLQIITSH